MGGVNSQNASAIQDDIYDLNQDDDDDDDDESSYESCDQERQGVWSFIRHFGDEYLVRLAILAYTTFVLDPLPHTKKLQQTTMKLSSPKNRNSQ